MQKLLLLLLLSAILFFFSSCSMHEEIDLSKQGSGYYQMSFDMSTMVEMMKSMGGGQDKMPDSVFSQVKDSTFSLADYADSIDADLTPAEKSYFKNGTGKISVNMPENKMDIIMRFPVKDANDLSKFFVVMRKLDSIKTEKRNKEAAQSNNEMPNAMGGGGIEGMTDKLPLKPSPYIVTDTSIERTEQSKEEVMKDMGEEAQGAAMFLNQVTLMTTIKLPRPAKKLEGKNAKLSDDKKSIFLSASIQDMMDDPKAVTFKVIF